MAREESIVKMSADDAEVDKAWAKQFQMLNRLEQSLQSAGSVAGRTGQAGAKSFDVWARSISAASTAMAFFAKEAEAANRANLEAIRASSQVTKTWDQYARQFGLQGGIYDQKTLDQLQSQIAGIARKHSFSNTAGFTAAQDLASRGFSMQEVVEGGVLDEILGGMASMNQIGQDPIAFIGAITSLLEAFGKELTAENVRDAARQIWGGFKGSPLQASHVARSAPEATAWRTFTGGTMEEFVASQAVLSRTISDPGQQATVMRNVAANFATAGTQAAKRNALLEAGLSPEEVDFEGPGEGWLQFLDKMAEVKAAMSPEEWKNFAATMADKANVAGFSQMVEGREEIRQRMAFARDDAGYQRDIQFASSGEAAAARRSEAQLEQSKFMAGTGAVDVFRNAIETLGREVDPTTGEARFSPKQIQYYQELYDKALAEGYDAREALILSVGENLDMSRNLWNSLGGFFSGDTWKGAYQQGWTSAGRQPDVVNEIFTRFGDVLERLDESQAKTAEYQERLLELQERGYKVVVEVDGTERPGRKVAP